MTSRGRWTHPREHRERRGAGLAWCRRAGLLPVAWLTLTVACGGDTEPAGGGAEPGAAEREPVPAEPETEPPRSEVEEAGAVGVSGDPEAADEGEGEVEGGSDRVGEDDEAEGVDAEAVPPSRVPAGTRLSVTSAQDISTADYSANDPVLVTVAEHVVDSSGAVLIPQGVSLLGRVVDATGSGGPGEAPILEIAFETLSGRDYERPVEGTIIEADVVLDAEAEAMRRASAGRVAAVTVVPGKILAGSVIVVELRAPVSVPPVFMWLDSLFEGDSLFRADSSFRADTFPGRDPFLRLDTLPRRDTIGIRPAGRYSR
ncbi:MAG: hypothetical protein OXE96_01830 [Gemmatimonadetes bacterium]|nr:hypothetical protein [Gemmatimonadota bacterium]